ncbi:uncharacterized protein LOC130508243 [Raphanus sativus]|nr:uncharacterized protein LOC130508243 [Raphanus sativus]
MEAAYKPEVNDELDTQNFMKFDEVNSPATERTKSGTSRKNLAPKDLSFVGYTYKNFDAVKGLRHSLEMARTMSLDRSPAEVMPVERISGEAAEAQMVSSMDDPMVI